MPARDPCGHNPRNRKIRKSVLSGQEIAARKRNASAPNHSLVIGGTGMLTGVCLHLVRRGDVVSVVARHRQDLDHLADLAAGLPGSIRPVAVDYGNLIEFDRRLRAARDRNGPFSLIVAWIHATSPEAPAVTARLLGQQNIPSAYLDIVGSASSNPMNLQRNVVTIIDSMPRVVYRKVVLDHITEPGGGRRWLTHEEIHGGIIDALTNAEALTVIGTVDS